MEYLPPLIVENAVFMDIFEDLHLISSSVDVEPVLVPHKCVIRPCFRDLVDEATVSNTSRYRLRRYGLESTHDLPGGVLLVAFHGRVFRPLI